MDENKKNDNTATDADENNKKQEQNSERIPQRPKPRNRRSYVGILIACAVMFIVLYAITNLSTLSLFMSRLMSVLSPVLMGFAIAYLLNPLLNLFERTIFKKIKNRRLIRFLSIFTTYATALLIITGIVFLLIPQLVESITVLVGSFDSYIDHTVELINGFISDLLSDSKFSPSINREQIFNAIKTLFTQSGDAFETIGEYVIEYGTNLVVGVKNVIFAIFISIYVLFSKEHLGAQLNKLTTAIFRPKEKEQIYKYARLCNKTFGGFFIGKIIDSIIIGILTLITLLIFDMPYSLLVSAIVGVTNIIPIFGPFIGAIPSFFIIFIVDPAKALIFLVLILIIQQIDGNIIGPKILGDSTGLSSLGVMVSIIIMGDYFGVIGMIVGVPIFAVILTIINEFAESKLRKKNLPVNLAEYYHEDSVLTLEEEKETFSHRIFLWSGNLFATILKLIFRIGKKETKKEKSKKSKKEDQK